MSQAQKGRKTSEKTKDLLRAAVERRKRAGAKVNQYGAYKGGLENKLRLNLQRISKKKHADGSYTTKEWQELKEKSGNKCVFCHRAEADVTLSADHIVPLTKGGTNFIENIQPLCRSCNSKKGNRLISFYLLSKV